MKNKELTVSQVWYEDVSTRYALSSHCHLSALWLTFSSFGFILTTLPLAQFILLLFRIRSFSFCIFYGYHHRHLGIRLILLNSRHLLILNIFKFSRFDQLQNTSFPSLGFNFCPVFPHSLSVRLLSFLRHDVPVPSLGYWTPRYAMFLTIFTRKSHFLLMSGEPDTSTNIPS